MASLPDPKPRKRRKLSGQKYRALSRQVREAFPWCELCGEAPSESVHHVVPRSQGGDDVAENLVALCGHGTIGCHWAVEESREARSRLRPRLRPEVVIYAIGRKGEGWFDARYPE